MKIATNIFIIGVLLIVVAALIWNFPAVERFFTLAIEFFKSNAVRNPAAAVVVFVGLSALSAMFSPLSSVPLVPFAVAVWGNAFTFWTLLAGWMIGGMATYAIGRYATYPILKNFKFYKNFDHYQAQFSATTKFELVLLFRLALPAEIPGYVLGSLRYSFWKYLVATFISELVIVVPVVFGGKALLDQNEPLFIGLVIAGIITFSIFLTLLSRALSKPR